MILNTVKAIESAYIKRYRSVLEIPNRDHLSCLGPYSSKTTVFPSSHPKFTLEREGTLL